MKWMNFIPLLIWALSLLVLFEWGDHLRQIDGREKATKDQSKACASLYLFGCGAFLIIGVILSI